MVMFRHILVLLAVLAVHPSTWACLWDSSIDPVFLNANPISVCINAPTEVDETRHFAEFRRVEAQVRESIRGLDRQTSLSFSLQQGYCATDNESLQNPQIRLTLDSTIGTGRAVVEGDFSRGQSNVFLPYLGQSDGRGNEVDQRHNGNMNFLTHHEILHLLGIQHDDRSFTGEDPNKRRAAHPELIELTAEHAETSVMNILGNEMSPLLLGSNIREGVGVTPEDIACIDLVLEAHRGRQQGVPLAHEPDTAAN